MFLRVAASLMLRFGVLWSDGLVIAGVDEITQLLAAGSMASGDKTAATSGKI